MEKRKAEKEARPYQIELLNKALQQNSIVYLGTGAGKTFIATMMIKEKMSDILHENKKTVFLAHRVPLVTQQAKFIKDNTPLTVRSFSGGSCFRNYSNLLKHFVISFSLISFKIWLVVRLDPKQPIL